MRPVDGNSLHKWYGALREAMMKSMVSFKFNQDFIDFHLFFLR